MTGHKTQPEKELNWLCQAFDAVDKYHFYAAIALRQHTFVVEQNLNYQDADWEDFYAKHILGIDGEDLAVYARILLPSEHEDEASIGRIVTAPAYRDLGFGDKLMHRAFACIYEDAGDVPIAMSIQTSLEKFYAKYGFERVGEDYLEAGIPHLKVVRPSSR